MTLNVLYTAMTLFQIKNDTEILTALSGKSVAPLFDDILEAEATGLAPDTQFSADPSSPWAPSQRTRSR